MRTRVLPVVALDDALIERWGQLQRADAGLHSPFFRPEFAAQVAAVSPHAEVAVLEDRGAPVGFFPFERGRHNIARPIGGVLNDFQAVVAQAGTAIDAAALVRDCGLRAWHFHHLLVDQQAFAAHRYCVAPSLYLDLRGGFEAYCRQRAEAGSQQVAKTRQKLRKWTRDLGPLEFVAHTSDGAVFETLLRWKSEQYARIGAINYLAPLSTQTLLRRIVQLPDVAFSGMLSALYCGGELAAVHLGLRSHEVLHSWFPTYNPAFAAYSPGMVLFYKLAEVAPSLAIERIDLGRGAEQLKVGLGSAGVSVAEGSVDLRPLGSSVRRSCFQIVRWLHASKLGRPARAVANWLPSLRRWATFH